MGTLITLTIAVIKALTAYLELKSKSFYYDLIERSRTKQQQLINEIEKLRSLKSTDSSDRADLMRQYLIEEKQFIKHLSAEYSSNTGGYGSEDKGG